MKAHRKHVGFVALFAVVFTCGLSWAGDVWREFEDAKGRTITAQLMDFDAKTQMVTIMRENDKETRRPVKLDIFSEETRKYILNWAFERDFMYAVDITAEAKEFKDVKKSYKGDYKPECVQCMGYEIKLENKSDFQFEQVEIEYILFYRQEVQKGQRLRGKGQWYDIIMIEPMMPGSNHDLKTQTVLIYNEEAEGAASFFGSTATVGGRGELEGLWLRAHTARPDGETITREVKIPRNLARSHSWENTIIIVSDMGLNEFPVIQTRMRLPRLKLPEMYDFYIE